MRPIYRYIPCFKDSSSLGPHSSGHPLTHPLCGVPLEPDDHARVPPVRDQTGRGGHGPLPGAASAQLPDIPHPDAPVLSASRNQVSLNGDQHTYRSSQNGQLSLPKWTTTQIPLSDSPTNVPHVPDKGRHWGGREVKHRCCPMQMLLQGWGACTVHTPHLRVPVNTLHVEPLVASSPALPVRLVDPPTRGPLGRPSVPEEHRVVVTNADELGEGEGEGEGENGVKGEKGCWGCELRFRLGRQMSRTCPLHMRMAPSHLLMASWLEHNVLNGVAMATKDGPRCNMLC